MVRAICGLQLIGQGRAEDLMQLLGLNMALNQLAMANSVFVLV